MPAKTPVEIVERMIERKRRSYQRLIESLQSADYRRPSPQQLASDAIRLAEVTGAIDILLETLEEMQALVAEEVEPESLGKHMPECRYHPLSLTEDYLNVLDCCCDTKILLATQKKV